MAEQKNSFTDKVLTEIQTYRMFVTGMTVIVGVSGGADSTALLHWLACHAEELSIRVAAAHVNHGIRGAEADRDESFVREICEQLHVPLHILHTDIPKEAKKAGEGLEECGRRVRYAFFLELCEQYKNACIATAHTLSDCAETMLFNLTRGCGLAGLSGIPPVRGKIIRPFLAVTRAQTEQYCHDHTLSYVTDSTNHDTAYSRNRIRLNVVPQLCRIDANFEQAAGRAARSLREDEECLCTLAKQALQKAACSKGWLAQTLAEQPRAVRMRALAMAAEASGAGQLEQKHVDLLDSALLSGGGCTLPGGCSARVEQGRLLFPKYRQEAYCVPLCVPQTHLPDGRLLTLKIMSRREYEKEKPKIIFSNCLNYDTISCDTVIRTRRSGDTFAPAGRNVTKSLKKLMNEQKIPASLRPSIVMIADCNGILWIEGCGPSRAAEVTQAAQHIAAVIIKECV